MTLLDAGTDMPVAAEPAPAFSAATRPAPRISLEALGYYWPKQQVEAFYEQVRQWPADVVYLGETVCSRRHEMRLEDWLAVAVTLVDAGKEVVLSTQALLESESDLKALRRLIDAAAADRRLRVEANDFGAVRLLAELELPFVAGPGLNVFNPQTLDLLAELGATRWVMPAEMSGATLRALLSGTTSAIATEALVWGRLPLALSARCFTARHYRLQKDACAFKCAEFPDGLPLRTREGELFLVLNGVQTQSAKVYNLLPQTAEIVAAGVDVLRIAPRQVGTADVIAACRRQLDAPGSGAAPERDETLAYCNGFWHGHPGLEQID